MYLHPTVFPKRMRKSPKPKQGQHHILGFVWEQAYLRSIYLHSLNLEKTIRYQDLRLRSGQIYNCLSRMWQPSSGDHLSRIDVSVHLLILVVTEPEETSKWYNIFSTRELS